MKRTCTNRLILWIYLSRLAKAAVIIAILSCGTKVSGAPYMRLGELIDSPTASVPAHGIFQVNLGATLINEPNDVRQEMLLGIDMGVLDRLAVGVTRLDLDRLSVLQLHLGVQLLEDIGGHPALRLGIESVGESLETEDGILTDRYHTNSPYVVVQKRFTLPVTQQFDLHLGWGDGRFRPAGTPQEWMQGAFFGISKEWSPRLLRGTLQGCLDMNTYGTDVGVRYQLNTGTEIQASVIGLGQGRMRYWLGVGWTNGRIQRQMKAAEALARNAAKLALEKREEATTHDE